MGRFAHRPHTHSVRLAPFARLVHVITLDPVLPMLYLIPHVVPPFLSIFAIYVGLWSAISCLLAILLEDTDLPIGRCAAQAIPPRQLPSGTGGWELAPQPARVDAPVASPHPSPEPLLS